MSLLGDLADLVLGGEDWSTRLSPTIDFISPDGESDFTAKWVGSPRSLEKRLGIFDYPGVNGNVVVDLGVRSVTYSLTFYFDGPDNDSEARRFFEAAKQKGEWTVTHPIHGFLGLQLVRLTEDNQPVTSGNITQMSSEWLEPVSPDTLLTAAESFGADDSLSTAADSASFAQNVADTATTTSIATQSAISISKTLADKIDATTEPVRQDTNTESEYNAVRRDLDNTLSESPLDVEALTGQLQSLVKIPANGAKSGDTTEATKVYKSLATDLLSLLPSGVSVVAKNQVAAIELTAASAVQSLSTLAINSKPETREQAVTAAVDLFTSFDELTNSLDVIQTNFEDETIDKTYFSQSQTYVDMINLISNTVLYLLGGDYDLKVERRFTLARSRSTMEVAVTEYEPIDAASADEAYSFFIRTNKLTGKEILFLPAGFNAVVYL